MPIRAAANQGDLSTLKKALRACTAQVDAATGQLTRATGRRLAAEAALSSSATRQGLLRQRSASLLREVRHLGRELLARQEHLRTRISRTLHDDLAQTLLGINVHLLMLKTRSGIGRRALIDDIVKAQSLVDAASRSMRRALRRTRGP